MKTLRYLTSIYFLKLYAVLKKIHTKSIWIFRYFAFRANRVVKQYSEKQQDFWLKKKRACHFHELFITHKGEIFPCCMIWGCRDMKIGHIHDDNLIGSLRNFYSPCSCARFELRKGLAQDKIAVDYINIEVSLLCQGKCAMCGVNAPSWHGEYDYYDSLTQIINEFSPRQILVQGGEVLIQKETLEWIEKLRSTYPHLQIIVSTNGNVDLSLIDKVEELFYGVNVSFVGFQPLTYATVMGMDINKAVRFSEELAKRRKVRLVLKYLTTPVTIHEFSLFLDWAINLNPAEILVDDANTFTYVNIYTSDNFWEKIFERTKKEVREVLINNKDKLSQGNTTFGFSARSIEILRLKPMWENFLKETGIQEKTHVY